MWLVVKFVEDYVEIVPTSWCSKEHKTCAWPTNEKRGTIAFMIKSKVYPKDNWKKYRVKILGEYGKSPTIFFS